MTVADITFVIFMLCNSLRILAYVPQIARAAKDPNGAQAISFATWGLFLVCNVSAVAYAVVNKADPTMAIVFTGNGFGCCAILLIGAWKRAQHTNRFVEQVAWARRWCAMPPVLAAALRLSPLPAGGERGRRGTSR